MSCFDVLSVAPRVAGHPAASSMTSALQRPVAGRKQKKLLAQSEPLDDASRTNITAADTIELAALQQSMRRAQRQITADRKQHGKETAALKAQHASELATIQGQHAEQLAEIHRQHTLQLTDAQRQHTLQLAEALRQRLPAR